MPVDLLGINRHSMASYVRFITDRLLYELIGKKIYSNINPFDLMENISLEGKSNMFERRISEYKRSMMSDKQFSVDEEF